MTRSEYQELVEFLGRRFEAIDQRFEAIDQRFDAIDRRFDAMDQRFDAMDQRFEAMDQRFEAMDQRFEAIDQRFEAIEARLTRVEVMEERNLHYIQLVAEGLTAHRESAARGFAASAGLFWRRERLSALTAASSARTR